ncbi:mpv17-like protein [Teleopsis dalmanni]|uniref:mpv17-like protein n=1 Tax=Teleopsis dalmanni TaxID=139649 RepID=UPI0018CDA707|nr:mpv17-like protein [Teleopsis dalmanni]XP_037947501.1 mpv17-like protein [Teleopsis dalmanni]XP_037947502.1 mpv17-like protein [Teleopsis dalmanni]XP_037947504.1 mpv17-like protein [Teleopsis dalmanni]XP_037947505.1 mpv17-like protein [Teleopsis dalmanni]
MIRNFINFTHKYKIVRGMISYGLLWPCGCLIEQTIIEKRTFRNYDWKKCLRFSLFGALFMGPTIYVWIRLASVMWPRTDIKSSLCKAITEQAAYDPFAISSFLFCTTLMEDRTYKEAKQEVSNKFFDAYKVGVIYWPCMQTVNFAFVPLRNQVVFTSFFSMCWTTFLTYIKYIEIPHVDLDHHAVDIHFLDL